MAFWDTWETWAKMSFILASSIVSASPDRACKIHPYQSQGAVLVYAFGIRWRNKRRVKRYSERNASVSVERNHIIWNIQEQEEVPFGIRAIERGCEIDGVWNSRTNTPLHTPRNSTHGSQELTPKMLSTRLPSLRGNGRETATSTMSNLEIPEPALARLDPNVLPEGSADTKSETNRSSEKEDEPENFPDRQFSMRGRRAYQPKTSPRNVSYPPSAYPPPNSSRSRSYPPSAYHPPSASKYRSYPQRPAWALDSGNN